MKDADDAESRSALASIVKLSGESTRTRHVISSASDVTPAAVCEMIAVGCVDREEVDGVNRAEVEGINREEAEEVLAVEP